MYLGESALATNWHRKISQRNLLRVKKPSSIIKVGNAYNILRLQAVHMSFGRLAVY